MRYSLPLLSLLLLFLAMTACQPQAEEPTATAEPTDVEDELEAIRQARAELIGSLKNGDMDRLMSLVSDDPVWMPPDQPILKSKEAIRSMYQNLFEQNTLELMVTHDEERVSGSWGFDRCSVTGRLIPKSGDAPVQVDNKVMAVFQKQPDGSWKFLWDIWNSDFPPPVSSKSQQEAPEAGEPPVPLTATGSDVEAFKKLIAEFDAAMNAEEFERLVSLNYTEDAVRMPPNEPMVRSRGAILAFFKRQAEQTSIKVDNVLEDVKVSGDMAFIRGCAFAASTPKAGGDPISRNAKFLALYDRQADGSWKCFADIYNFDGPVPPEQQ